MSSVSPFVRGPAAQIRATEIVMTQTPPPIIRPSDRDQKYDRQLRLWAQSGQEALEKARILLVNSGCGAVGVETLKNLVLPGIGNFTIFDENTVEEADLGVNFFLDEDCLGKPRAQCCAELLMELNPDAQGDWFPKNQGVDRLEHVLATSPRITMIIFTFPAKEEHIAMVENYGRINKTPVIAVHSAGFYGYFRIDLPGPFPIVETHPDTAATTDLRLLNPWPELMEFAQELTEDFENLDNHKHGHLPYVVILLHYLEKWRQEHGGADPSTFKEKVAFRKCVEAGMRRDNAEGGEENFEEAIAAVLKTIVKPSLPSSLREVFEYHPDPAESTSRFWAIAAALRAFYAKHQRLPVTGSVPDMKAQSDVYIRLQKIYKTKALEDAAEVLSLVKQPEGDTVKSEDVQMFCKNAAFVKLINATDRDPNLLQKVVENELTVNDASLLPIYLALSATSSAADKSAEQILASISAVLPNISGVPGYERLVQVAQEVARTGGGELHNISSLMGGMVAQEMIKIITKQYIPIDNTCIFDGIISRCQVVRL